MAVRRRRGLSFDILGQDKTGRAFSQVNRRLKTLGAGALRAGKALAAVGTAAAAGLAVLAKKSIDAADKIAKTADSIGLSTDALQELRFAADISGVSVSQLDTGLQAFGKRVGELRSDTGALSTFLNKLDEDFAGQVRAAGSVDEAFDLVVRRMAKMENQTDRAALSAAAFGRTAGVEMTNLVKNGVDALDELRRKAQDLGLVMEEDLLRNAEGAKDALTILTSVIKTRLTVAIIKAAPTIERFALGLVKVIEKIDQFFKAPEEARLSAEIAAVEADLEDLEKTAARVALGLQQPIMGLDTLIGRTEMRLGDLREELARLRGEIEKTAPALPGLGLPRGGGAQPPVPDKKPIEALTKALAAETAALAAEKDVVTAKVEETGALVDMEGELKNVMVDVTEKGIRGQITEWDDLRGVAVSALQDIISHVLQLNSSMSAGGGGGGFLGFLSGLFGGGLGPQFTGTGAEGLASSGSFHRGGSLVAGPSGGPDSQLMVARVSPGERIDFTPRGGAQPAGRAPGPVFNVDMRGASAEAVARLEQLVAQVNGSIERRALAAVAENGARGGRLGAALGGV